MIESIVVFVPMIFGGLVFSLALALDPHDVLLSDVGTPESFEERGYTRESIDILLETEIERLVRAAASHHKGKRVKVGALKTGLDNLAEAVGIDHAIAAAQQVLGLTGYLVEINFTSDSDDQLAVSVYVNDPNTLETLSMKRFTHESQSPEALIRLAALNIVEVTQPYIYASYLYEKAQDVYAVGQDGSDMMDEAITWIDHKLLDETLVDIEEFYNLRGLIALEKGQYDIAIRNFRLSANYDPDFTFPYINWGRVWLQLGYPDRAERYFDLAKAVGDEHVPIIHVYRARAELSEGNPERALDVLIEAEEEAPELAQLYMVRAEAFDQLGEKDAAAAARRDSAKALILRSEQSIFDPY